MQPVDELITRLANERAVESRLASVRLLGETGDGAAVGPLLETLVDYDARVYNAVLAALEVLASAAVGPLCRRLRDPRPVIRLAAATALGRIGDPAAVGPLCGALRDTDALVAETSADALGRIGTAEVVRPLCRALLDLNWEAGRALGRIDNPAAVRALCEELTRSPEYVCVEIASALARIAERHPLPELRPAAGLLRRRLARWSLETEQASQTYRAALDAIDRATAWLDSVRDLPMPAGAAPLPAGSLPVPASSPGATGPNPCPPLPPAREPDGP